MKKTILFLLTAAMLVFSVAAVNAPLTAAEFFAGRDIAEDASSGGTIGFYHTEPLLPLLLNTEITGATDPSLWVLNSEGTDYLEEIDPSANVFDIMAKFDTAKAYAGYKLHLFYNPEIIMPFERYRNSVYDVNIIDGYDAAELPENITLGIAADYMSDVASYTGDSNFMTVQSMDQMTDTSVAYTYYLEGTGTLDEYNNEFTDGNAVMVASKGSNISISIARKSELARWPFKLTDPTDNSWYRTTIVGSYDQFENATTQMSPTITNDGIIVIENENYTGPTFDIVGAESTMSDNAAENGLG